jgi:hypothetical protein
MGDVSPERLLEISAILPIVRFVLQSSTRGNRRKGYLTITYLKLCIIQGLPKCKRQMAIRHRSMKIAYGNGVSIVLNVCL